MRRASALAFASAGRSRAARMAMTAITTSSSINVKARPAVNLLQLLGKSGNSTCWERGFISAKAIIRVNEWEGAFFTPVSRRIDSSQKRLKRERGCGGKGVGDSQFCLPEAKYELWVERRRMNTSGPSGIVTNEPGSNRRLVVVYCWPLTFWGGFVFLRACQIGRASCRERV